VGATIQEAWGMGWPGTYPYAAANKAVDLGGTVIRDKMTGPAGKSVIVADPGGALVALFTPAAG